MFNKTRRKIGIRLMEKAAMELDGKNVDFERVMKSLEYLKRAIEIMPLTSEELAFFGRCMRELITQEDYIDSKRK